MYKYRETRDRRFILSVDNHTEISAALAAFCREKDIRSGIVGGIAAISKATFRFLDPATKKYVDKTFEEQMEITCLAGNISRKDGEPYLHLHVTLADMTHRARGGHANELRVSATCEMTLSLIAGEINRGYDAVTGLNLYQFD